MLHMKKTTLFLSGESADKKAATEVKDSTKEEDLPQEVENLNNEQDDESEDQNDEEDEDNALEEDNDGKYKLFDKLCFENIWL